MKANKIDHICGISSRRGECLRSSPLGRVGRFDLDGWYLVALADLLESCKVAKFSLTKFYHFYSVAHCRQCT